MNKAAVVTSNFLYDIMCLDLGYTISHHEDAKLILIVNHTRIQQEFKKYAWIWVAL